MASGLTETTSSSMRGGWVAAAAAGAAPAGRLWALLRCGLLALAFWLPWLLRVGGVVGSTGGQ